MKSSNSNLVDSERHGREGKYAGCSSGATNTSSYHHDSCRLNTSDASVVRESTSRSRISLTASRGPPQVSQQDNQHEAGADLHVDVRVNLDLKLKAPRMPDYLCRDMVVMDIGHGECVPVSLSEVEYVLLSLAH